MLEHSPNTLTIEQPTRTANCPCCGCQIKESSLPNGEQVLIRFPYLTQGIVRYEGHFYEFISRYFQHQCPLTALDSLELVA